MLNYSVFYNFSLAPPTVGLGHSPSPAGLVSTDVSLDGCGSMFHAQVLLVRQPAADSLLDADAGGTQLICTQFLQVRNLACTEKDLGLAKLVLIWILLGGQKSEERIHLTLCISPAVLSCLYCHVNSFSFKSLLCYALCTCKSTQSVSVVLWSDWTGFLYLHQFLQNILTGHLLICQNIFLFHQDTIPAKELLIRPPDKQTQTYSQGLFDKRECSMVTCRSSLYLDGKPAAEMRIVSKTPHARSCCTALLGSNLVITDIRYQSSNAVLPQLSSSLNCEN